MLKKLFVTLSIALALAATTALAQNTNTGTTRSRQTTPTTQTNTSTTTTTTTTKKEPVTTGEAQDEPRPAATPAARRSQATRAARNANDAATQAVRAAFDALIDGITRADVDAVMNVYWNSPQLILFNNNGTVTRSWAQVRANRASSYPNLKDVKIAVRDVRVQMLGSDAALVTCLWTQTQTYKDVPETATGRLSLAFRRFGTEWKVVHTHTSPDAPDPSRLLPSEQNEPATTTTTTTPTAPKPSPTPKPPARP